MTQQDYLEILGEYRDLDQPKPQRNYRRLYQILAGIQLGSVLTVLYCAMYVAGSFG